MPKTGRILKEKHTETNKKQPKIFKSNYTRPNVSYTSVTRGNGGQEKEEKDELQEMMTKFKKLNKKCNIRRMISILKEANKRMEENTSGLEKLMTMEKVAKNLDG